MEPDEIVRRLGVVRSALERVATQGKQNLLNLGGSLDMLDELAAALQKEDGTGRPSGK